ncbi:MAG: glucose-6-phosphate dehydrogenase assembly protein OpcA [Armatimonadota bacterium]
MPEADAQFSFAPGVLRCVRVPEVEKALADLWRAANEAVERGAVPVTTRAALLSLVVLCRTEEEAETAARTVALLVNSHPSRAVIAVVNPHSSDEHADAFVSAHCSLTSGSARQVCCEEVRLHLNGPVARFLSATVSSLLLPDLPVFGWVVGDPSAWNSTLLETAALCDKLLINTGALRSPVDSLPSVAAVVAGTPDAVFGDLLWIQLEHVRSRIVSAFDDPEAVETLSRAAEVELSVPSASLSAALLTVGWFAHRLRWTPESQADGDDGCLFRFRAEDGAARSVKLKLGGTPDRAALLLPAQGRNSFRVELPGFETVPPAAPIEAASTAASASQNSAVLLCEALEYPGRESEWEHALYTAAAMLKAPRNNGN